MPASLGHTAQWRLVRANQDKHIRIASGDELVGGKGAVFIKLITSVVGGVIQLILRGIAGCLVAGALGGVALKVAWATPPTGVTNIPIAGPVTFGEIHAMTLDRDYTALVKTRGLSDGYVRYLKIAPGGNTGWHSRGSSSP